MGQQCVVTAGVGLDCYLSFLTDVEAVSADENRYLAQVQQAFAATGNEVAQQQSSPSGGTSFWRGLTNLLHGHSWNYIKTSVTDSESYTIAAGPNGYVTAATDTAGIVGTVAPKMAKDLHLGPLGAGASILNDPSPWNTFTNLLGLAPGFDGPLAVTGAFSDFLTWGVENGQGRSAPKAYGSEQLAPTLPTEDGGCQAAGLPSC